MRHVHFGALMIVSSEVTAICHQLKSKADLSTTKEMVITMKKEKRKKKKERGAISIRGAQKRSSSTCKQKKE